MDKIDDKPYIQKAQLDYLSTFARGNHETIAHTNSRN